MSNSPLVDVSVPADPSNYTHGRAGVPIRRVTVHHMAGVLSAEECGSIFQNPGRGGSSHYGVGKDGRIGLYVDEENIAWTNSNWNSNCESVTIETSNSAIGGDWPVSDATFDSLVRLVADIANRNGLGVLVPGDNLTWHSMFTSTSCPGRCLLSRMQLIADRANEINSKPTPAPTPTPTPTEIHAGDTVRPTRLVDYDGTPLIQYDDTYVVTELIGDRAVCCANRGGNMIVWAAMHVSDLEKV